MSPGDKLWIENASLKAENTRLREMLRECAEMLAVAQELLDNPKLKGVFVFAIESYRIKAMARVKERIEKVLKGEK